MRIRLLGGLDVTSPDGGRIRFSTRKTSLLFAALVLAGRRGHRREPLAEAFWPGRGDAQARNSLRQALVDIRRAFPGSGDAAIQIEGDQETVALKAGLHEVDTWMFDRKLEEGGPADLVIAADLYRGDVLASLAIPEELDEWFASYRSTYQRKALQLVERLSLSWTVAGSAQELACEGLAERLLVADPTAEPCHRFDADPRQSRSRKCGSASTRIMSRRLEKASRRRARGGDERACNVAADRQGN
ncbi:hypothetical protein [Rhizobium sp. K102]|uniref:AfsR/SARP family transcriptional regulator n=1 Tax=Rhizobium sp. K102 TaxID=2918527 RepID=UPI001EFADD08|nr:hypothetical protein [Rhizobium sp. K102]ULR45555.1 hypothetical protein MHI61_10290 [Rhizobium sp. K102]